jgi:hypothetical protein
MLVTENDSDDAVGAETRQWFSECVRAAVTSHEDGGRWRSRTTPARRPASGPQVREGRSRRASGQPWFSRGAVERATLPHPAPDPAAPAYRRLPEALQFDIDLTYIWWPPKTLGAPQNLATLSYVS